jgi:hypothetical protein
MAAGHGPNGGMVGAGAAGRRLMPPPCLAAWGLIGALEQAVEGLGGVGVRVEEHSRREGAIRLRP